MMKTIEEFEAFLKQEKAEGRLRPMSTTELFVIEQQRKAEELNRPIKVEAFQAGNRLFKRQWNAWCYLAKCQLLDELEREIAKPGLWYGSEEWEAVKKAAFKAKYPSHHRHGELSTFYVTVMARARELRHAV